MTTQQGGEKCCGESKEKEGRAFKDGDEDQDWLLRDGLLK